LINNFLEVALPQPEHLGSIQLDYFGKVQLSLSIGLPVDLKKPLNFMGKARNNFAHKLGKRIDKNEVNNFFDTFSNEQKKEIIETSSIDSLSWVSGGKTGKSIESSDQFVVMCFALYYGVKIAILELEYQRKIDVYQKQIAKLYIKSP